jgi:hypothetical protein
LGRNFVTGDFLVMETLCAQTICMVADSPVWLYRNLLSYGAILLEDILGEVFENTIFNPPTIMQGTRRPFFVPKGFFERQLWGNMRFLSLFLQV